MWKTCMLTTFMQCDTEVPQALQSVLFSSSPHLDDAKSIFHKLIENNSQLKLQGEIYKLKKSFISDGIVPFTYLQSFSDRWCCGCLCPIWFEPKLPPNLFWHLLRGAKFTLPDWNNCVEGMTLWRRMWAKPSRRVRKSEKIKTFSEDVQDFKSGWHTSEYQPCLLIRTHASTHKYMQLYIHTEIN